MRGGEEGGEDRYMALKGSRGDRQVGCGLFMTLTQIQQESFMDY